MHGSPIKAFTSKIEKRKLEEHGTQFYLIHGYHYHFVWLKKLPIGYIVSSMGTGP
jgi:hypothetical protein